MFINISPSKFDVAVTNRSLKFARKTGKATMKLVKKTYQNDLKQNTLKREKFLQKHNLKLLKLSLPDQDV